MDPSDGSNKWTESSWHQLADAGCRRLRVDDIIYCAGRRRPRPHHSRGAPRASTWRRSRRDFGTRSRRSETSPWRPLHRPFPSRPMAIGASTSRGWPPPPRTRSPTPGSGGRPVVAPRGANRWMSVSRDRSRTPSPASRTARPAKFQVAALTGADETLTVGARSPNSTAVMPGEPSRDAKPTLIGRPVRHRGGDRRRVPVA